MKILLSLLVWTCAYVSALGQSTLYSNKSIQRLKSHVTVLASDSLEGRRAGTSGEYKSSLYIMNQLKQLGIAPKGSNNQYTQPFTINQGIKINPASRFSLQGIQLVLNEDYYPFSFSGSGKIMEYRVTPNQQAPNEPVFLDFQSLLNEHLHNPHADFNSLCLEKSMHAQNIGSSAVIWYHSGSNYDQVPIFDKKFTLSPLQIPVIFLTKKGQEHVSFSLSNKYDTDIDLSIDKDQRTAYNVIGYFDRKAPTTIVIGAHYDHLGRGEDGNSMLRAAQPSDIHNGADDNASGTAALLELAHLFVKQSKYTHSNILFIAFSGEELGLLGSRYFVDHPTIDLSTVLYMINMDMVGRLNDSTSMTIGGYGTSPNWTIIFQKIKSSVRYKFDSSGTGPSDHTSFYRKNIPVLFLFTGLHSDYHKPSDDPEKVNYTGLSNIVTLVKEIIDSTVDIKKMIFSPTRERQSTTSARFTVSLGIMPDYSFEGSGVRIDGVSEGKIASKVGIQAGDILVSLGTVKVKSVESYMQALSKFKKGDSTVVIVQRKEKTLTFDIQF